MKCYILQGHVAVPVDVLTWAQWFETAGAERIVGQETIGRWFVSTVFLGLDHSFGEGARYLFETMVFDEDGKSIDCTRYPTWDAAEAGHAHMTAYIAACGRPPGVEHSI